VPEQSFIGLGEEAHLAQFPASPAAGLPVAGIGASAGSAVALHALLGATLPGRGLAYVVIQDAGAVGLDSDALGRHTTLPVQSVEQDVALEQDHVYVVRSGCAASLAANRLRVTRCAPGARVRPEIDDFFRSLAAQRRERAIGVVLSGVGTQGTAGARAIRAAGGAFLAQDPHTAEFSGMARSVIEAGCADSVLPPHQLADALARLTSLSAAALAGAAGGRSGRGIELGSHHFDEITRLLRERTGRDLAGYKPGAVLGGVSRRMGLAGIRSLPAYLKRLSEDDAEVRELAESLLVSFTAFVRNPRAWEALRRAVIHPLCAGAGRMDPIRAWVPACASGEEAYSLAMLILEEAGMAGSPVDFKIYATDLSERSLAIARAGLYPLGIESELTAERLERFFEREPHLYRVNRELRQHIFFASHDLLNNPPLPSLDIVSCRNLLMHLNPDSQRRVLWLLHHALRAGGHLFLGSSESPQIAEGLFAPVSRPWRIYRRADAVRQPWPQLTGAAQLATAPSRRAERPPFALLPRFAAPPAQAASKLEAEIARLRNELQATTDALQVSTEELEAAHEEVMAIGQELEGAKSELTRASARLEARLREAQGTTEDLRSLLTSTRIAMLFLDEHLNVRFFTPAVKDLLELVPGDLGRPVAHLAPKFDDERLIADAHAVLQGSAPLEAEVSSQSGQWYMRRALPHRAADDRIGGVLITFINISPRKRVELELESANARLHEALESSEALREEAERANQSKDEFIATVSHELRTPLNTIRLWSRMLAEGKLSAEDAAQGANILERSALAQQKLIEDLLDLSRMSRGQLRLELRETRLIEVVEAAIAQTTPLAQPRQIQLTADLTDGIDPVRADPDRIQQVASNLLSNAVKFTPTGGRVHVRLHRAGEHMELEVSDSGVGIDPEFLPFVFDRFRQRAGTTRRQGGLGLGLSIAKELIELHGGTIRAESEGPGQGARFTFSLPLGSPATAAEDISAARAGSRREHSDLSRVDVLIVDAEPSAREALARLLEHHGAVVHSAGSCAAAREAVMSHRPDLIVADIGMPGEDGYSLLRGLRHEEEQRHERRIPALAVTALARPEDRQRALAAGFDDHLPKPVDPDRLLLAIATLTRSSASR
jgi:two-component system CheB/CheR fusion protein